MRFRGDVPEAVGNRSADFSKLLWKGEGSSFQIAVEARIPDHIRQVMDKDKKDLSIARYEVEIGLERESNEIGFNHETLWLYSEPKEPPATTRVLFPELKQEVGSIFMRQGRGRRAAINKKKGGNDNYYPDTSKPYKPSYRLGRTRSALANIPADNNSFPVGIWFRDMLEKLADHGYELDPHLKPLRPKEALEELMVYLSEPRSSILYERVTSRISLERCVDPAFNRLKAKLQAWFPA